MSPCRNNLRTLKNFENIRKSYCGKPCTLTEKDEQTSKMEMNSHLWFITMNIMYLQKV